MNMKNLFEKMEQKMIELKVKVSNELSRTAKEERGDIGIKQLAITVGVIVIVGAAVIVLKDSIGDIINDVWEWLFEDVIQKIGE